ncbi:MAG: DUF4962 domain-containing protein [Thermoguttaceae bacterium]
MRRLLRTGRAAGLNGSDEAFIGRPERQRGPAGFDDTLESYPMNRMFLPVLLQIATIVAAFFPAAATGADDSRALFSFEAGEDQWSPRADSIRVSREQGPGATPASQGSLHIEGRLDTGWNYAASRHQPIVPKRLYRLTAWLRVDRLGKETPPPYLKCEFVASDSRGMAGQVSTDRYDIARMGSWQKLVAEFQVPDGAATCWLALEKGTSGPAEIDARLDEITLETIARLSVIEQFRMEPMPASLVRVRGVHPRLYLDAARVAELRQAVGTTHAALWQEVREGADRLVKQGPPAYREQDGHSGDEQLWQREVGNAMPVIAMAYLVTGDASYLQGARAWALASCGYKTWGLNRIDGMDLAAGHQLFGLGIVYDWCYDGLDEIARQTIRQTIVRRGSAMFEAGATGKAWWQRSYMQNHLWVDACGLSVAGLAVFDEVDDANLWIGFGLDKFRRSVDALGPDGASHEGVGYWEYGVEYLLKFMHVARELLGEDLYRHPWWRATSRYPLYLGLPRDAWTRGNSIVDIADCPRGHWYGPDYLLRGLAREFRDPQAQWLAAECDDADVTAPGAPWLNLVWYDPTVPAEPPTALPTLHRFDDLGLVSARSDWSGRESLVVLKCGPFLGHKAVEEFAYDPGGGHVHPDANHFVVFGAGQWLLRDDGYRSKWTGQHNTLLVDGQGQLGEGTEWFQGSKPLAVKARPRVIRAQSGPTLDHIAADAAEAYPAELGIDRFERHLLYVKPDVLLILDEIRLKEPRRMELRFHPEQQTAQEQNRAFLMKGKTAVLRLESLTLEGVQAAASEVPIVDRHGGKDASMFAVRLARDGDSWRNAVALSWSAAADRPAAVNLSAERDRWTFRSGSRQVVFDWATRSVLEPTAK